MKKLTVILPTKNSEKYITIRIKDNGIGMSSSVQKNVFKKFYREERLLSYF